MRTFGLFIIGAITTACCTPDYAGAAAVEGREFFETKIRPVLAKHCYECHSAGAKKAKGGLLLDDRQALRAGGDSGPAVVPGAPNKSPLLQALRYEDLEMPPQGKLPDAVIADFERWVEMGAPDPRDGQAGAPGRPRPTTPERPWWSDPPRPLAIPDVNDMGWPAGAVDRFILAPLEQKGLRPVGDAEPATLLRRVHFDLVGLPPSPEEVDAFLRDPSPAAYERVVEKLLASPHFGERWGRHWLDLARYAESNGKGRNEIFPHAWRYRTYVIAAFNKDKPYDRFITEQIAGDLLPHESPEQRDDQVTATGFLALGPKVLTERGEQFVMNVVDEQIDITTRSILALTVACARCHDHKYDPIPTTDYYALAGIFRSTRTLSGHGIQSSSNKTTLINDRYYGVLGADPEAQLTQLVAEIETLKHKFGIRSKKSTSKSDPKPSGGKAAQLSGEEKKKAQDRLDNLESDRPATLRLAMAVADVEKPGDAHVLVRGEIGERGELVPRGMVSAVNVAHPIKIGPSGSGRLEFARWLTDPSNPLTSRVAVNRVWTHLFGRGIVTTVDNFGVNGEQPSNPALLDHLAVEFVKDGWSVKRLIRQIVLSRVYRLGGDHDERNFAADPENVLVWRMNQRRLDAESIRDAMMVASDQLDFAAPEGSLVVGLPNAGQFTKILERTPFPFRSVYLPIVRDQVPEMFELFDFADPNMVTGQRATTNVPAQSLYLMNSPFVLAQADGIAKRVLEATGGGEGEGGDRESIQLAYRLCLSRPASAKEVSTALTFIQSMDRRLIESVKKPDERRHAAWASYCQALLCGGEFRLVD